MTRAVDLVSIVLLICAIVTFVLGVSALADGRDLAALYWLVVGALVLRSAVDMLRPKTSSR